MAAPLGNQNAKKLKTAELKSEAYKQYCAHIAEGYNKDSFWFEHPDLSITWETMEVYIKDSPVDFPPIHKKMAHCKSYKKWEKVVMDSATGHNKDANTASLQMIMRHKFGWDKKEDNHEKVSEGTLEAHEKLIKRLDDRRREKPLSPSDKA
jgi:hypothetical protein